MSGTRAALHRARCSVPEGGQEPSEGDAGARWYVRAFRLPLWCHLLALAGVLLVLAPLLNLDDGFTIDEGAYAVQARSLENGRWEFDYQAEAVDRDGDWLPLYHAERGERGWYAYVKHPAYPVALLAGTRMVGDVLGLYLLTMLGALGVASAAWFLAADLDPALSRPSFWLAGSGPVLVNAFVVWAHAPSAALAGFATLAAMRLSADGRLRAAIALALLLAAGVAVRAEGILFAVAVAFALVTVGLAGRSWLIRLGAPGVCLAAAGTAMLAEQRWQAAILGREAPRQRLREGAELPLGADAGGGLIEWTKGRIQGGWHSMFQGSFDDPLSVVLVTAALMLTLYAATVVRRGRTGWRRDFPLLLSAVVLLYAGRWLVGFTDPITGLFAAWPVVFLGVALLKRPGSKGVRLLLALSGAFAAGVLATQYRIGGGREWGGRFFFPLLVPLAVVACSGLRQLKLGSQREGRVVTALLCSLAVVPTVLGLLVLRSSRDASAGVVDEVVGAGPELVLTHVLGLPPFAWRTYPGIGWMVVPPSELREATSRLGRKGVDRLTLVGPVQFSRTDVASYTKAEDVTGPEARRRGWRVLRLSEPAISP